MRKTKVGAAAPPPAQIGAAPRRLWAESEREARSGRDPGAVRHGLGRPACGPLRIAAPAP